jgi:hypothetical protein
MTGPRATAPLTLAFLLPLLLAARPAAAQAPGAEELMRRAHLVQFYAGDDLRAKVSMRLISRDGQERIRELTMLRKDLAEGGEQRYFIAFHKPADVRDVTFMVWKYPRRDDDRWLFIPALKLVKRIAASDKRSSFVGSDFSYEDISGREVEEDTHTVLREERLDGRETVVVKSVPRDEKGTDFGYKLSWIDRTSFVVWKEEYYDKRDDLSRVFTADEVKAVQGFPTAVKRTMRNVQTGHRTEVTFEGVEYNLGLRQDLFSERYLRNPPRDVVR